MRELTTNEVEQVSGGFDSNYFDLGFTAIGLGAALLVSGGLAGVPIAILGAATVGEVMLAGSAIALGATGGALVGTGISESAGSGSGLKDKDS